jgi:drug/metabolite transporter (DMT)-like permease
VAQVEPWQLALLILGGIANYSLGRALSYASIRRIGVARMAPLGAAWVVFASLLAVPLFGEPLTPRLLLGLALVFGGGVLLASR